jgi:hypothetical protein
MFSRRHGFLAKNEHKMTKDKEGFLRKIEFASRSKDGRSVFDGSKLHIYLRDEAGMEKDFSTLGEALEKQPKSGKDHE